jgi:glycosyltransferase involved in cell wall biosynthesis
MKVLRVISSMDPRKGGPCQGIRNAIPELTKLGVSNDVVCLDNPDENFITLDAFKIVALGPAKTSWCYSNKLKPWLLDNLCNYDVVIVHGLWQFHGYAVLKAIEQLKRERPSQAVPFFYVMPHGMLDPYFQIASGRKLKAIRNNVYWKFIESKIINNANGLLFTCKAELMLARTTFKDYYPLQELNIGYGIEQPPAFVEEMNTAVLNLLPAKSAAPYLLFLSRIHPKKGIDLLIDAYIELSQENNDLPFLLIAGPGLESEYGMSLKNMVAKHPNISDKVIFTGMLSGNNKWGAFYRCEAFVLPSHQENFGIAVVEALACSKPVIISDQVNIWNEINETGGGIVGHDDLGGIRTSLKSWLNLSQEQRKQMGENAALTYSSFFSIEKSALKFMQTMQEQLQSGRPANTRN